MQRSISVVLGATVCLLVPASGSAAATGMAALPMAQSGTGPQLALKGTNGYGIVVSAVGRRVSLTAFKGLTSASYFARGRASSRAIHARIGKFGRISVRFRPGRKVKEEKPPKGCKGKPLKVRSGVFVGTIKFVGEGRYTRVNARRARGTLRPAPRWNCKRQRAREKASENERIPGLSTIAATSSGGSRLFSALGLDLLESDEADLAFFIAGQEERRGSVRIMRLGIAIGEGINFSFDQAHTTATVRPPRPFRGEATFLRNEDGSTSWSGSLRVSLPGADQVSLAGPSFSARLDRPKTIGQFLEVVTGER